VNARDLAAGSDAAFTSDLSSRDRRGIAYSATAISSWPG